jgi:broad specificity phosphatase PhoE
MPIVTLVRHGESDSNAGGPALTSPSASPLTKAGRKQASNFAATVCTPPGFVVRSPFVRAHETAEPLLLKFPEVPSETWPVQEFTFLDPDRCANTTVHDRAPMREAYYAKADPGYCDGGAAESFADFAGRVKSFIERARQLEYETVFVFTHGLFIRLVEIVLERPDCPMPELMRRYLDQLSAPAIGNCASITLSV